MYRSLFKDPDGVHGVSHSLRVWDYVLKINKKYNLDKRSLDILKQCSLYHDIGRVNNCTDTKHGERSIEKLDDFQIPYDPYAAIIIRNHCLADSTGHRAIINHAGNHYRNPAGRGDIINHGIAVNFGIFLLDLFKDADALDRQRTKDKGLR